MCKKKKNLDKLTQWFTTFVNLGITELQAFDGKSCNRKGDSKNYGLIGANI